MDDLTKAIARREEQRKSIAKLVTECVRMCEYEPGKWWALINLPDQSSKTIYKGVVQGHAEMLCAVARAAMEHALNYAVMTSDGVGEEAALLLLKQNFIHQAHDFQRHAAEISDRIAALTSPPAVQEGAQSAAPAVDERDAEGSGDSRHPSFCSVPPTAVLELSAEVERG